MSKEKINGAGIQLSEKNIFGSSSQWYDLTPLGSCLEGICSVRDYLKKASNNGVSDDKREEWSRDIEDRFSRAEELMGAKIPKSERDVLLEKHKAIVDKRMSSLAKLSTLVTKS